VSSLARMRAAEMPRTKYNLERCTFFGLETISTFWIAGECTG